VSLDLDALALAIAEPDADLAERTRARLEAADGTGYGRLTKLAAWWASTRGDERAAPPLQVLHLGVGSVALQPVPDGAWTEAGPASQPETSETSETSETAPGTRPEPPALPVEPARPRTTALAPPTAARLEHRALDATAGLPDDVDAAIGWAVALVDAAVDAGTDLLLLGVPDPFPGRLLAAALMGLDPVEATGWPDEAGLDDESWMAEVAALRDGLVGLRPVRGEPLELLRALGHPGVAAGTAALLQAAARRTPVLLDGPGAATVALLARRAVRASRGWWQAGSGSGQNLHERSLTSLRLEPLVRLEVQREDGTGARLGLAVLEAAAGLLRPES
jgi:nicotinate-nucleotide--dimethylbenzimidazole phosphoribosyltransferase